MNPFAQTITKKIFTLLTSNYIKLIRDIAESKFSTVPLFGLCDSSTVAHTKAARNIGPVDVISDLMAKRVLQEVLISKNFTLSKSRMIILLVYLNDFAKKLGSIIINQW